MQIRITEFGANGLSLQPSFTADIRPKFECARSQRKSQFRRSLPLSLVSTPDVGNPGSNVSSANLPARLVKANGSVKRAFYMKPTRVAMRVRKGAGTPPDTH